MPYRSDPAIGVPSTTGDRGVPALGKDGSGNYQVFTVDASGNIATATGGVAAYILQEPDDYTTTNVTYLGKMKTDGTYLIVKIDETGNFPTFRYANVSNNATLTTYALAWAARTTATYNYLNVLTGV
jgi:hypothetical protein